MLRPQEVALLKSAGRATPHGKALRRYWLPVLPADAVAAPDGPPVEVRVLNEPLVLFRDSAGRLGCLDAHCPHEGASLKWGVNQEGGLSCFIHGWKFDVEGLRIDSGAVHMRRVQTRAYPVLESEGRVWVFLGELPAPPLPAGEPERRPVPA
jgi:phenylpropionate dioxygenase-like ring-hydroxylating dioxygenase large terminal subunit